MVKQDEHESYCTSTDRGICGYKVESLVNVDERGQMVLPKELRDKAGIKAGDKLAIISIEKNGKVHWITLIKVETLSKMIKDLLGAAMKELTEK